MPNSSPASRQVITPFIWCDNEAEDAARLYTSLFDDGRITHVSRYSDAGHEAHGQPSGKVMVAGFEIAGLRISALNGGPAFKPTPSLSFFVRLDTEVEVDALWKGLGEGGSVLMPLDGYPWSRRYGWLQDRYGVSWQIAVHETAARGTTITLSLMFARGNMGRAAEAIALYTRIFPDAAAGQIQYRDPTDGEAAGSVLFGSFTLFGQQFSIMDAPGAHDFGFTEGLSLMVSCDTQAEIDHYWEALTADGGRESQCGWLKDRFGVSWQITPTVMEGLMASSDAAAADRLMTAMLKMKKLDIATLEAAARGQL
jgi:predicted 3-demethylubiquinone-9 3-methyltransferase (glyoxalase superfamily)